MVVAEENQKNWKGMTIAFLVIVVILASVAVSVFLLTPPEAETGAIGLPFDLTDILDDRFIPRRFNGSWISGEEKGRFYVPAGENFLPPSCLSKVGQI